MIGIYKIYNKINGCYYIGSSLNVEARFRVHRSSLKKNKHHSPILQRAWNKYGEKSFIFEIIEHCTKEEILNRENYYLKTYTPYYNIAKEALAPMTGRKHSKETKKKLSRPAWNKGIPRTNAEKRLMSKNRKIAAKNMTKEAKEKWIENIKNNSSKYWLGKHIPKKAKQKISDFYTSNKNNWIKCKENGIIYKTQLEAAKDLKLRQGHISEHLKGKRPNVKGFTFSRIKKHS